jgi:hypothetical protein
MSKKNPKKAEAENSTEQITPEEALKRMKSFQERKEKFIAAVKKSKDRDLYSGTRNK